jgi:hypothetical protein
VPEEVLDETSWTRRMPTGILIVQENPDLESFQ